MNKTKERIASLYQSVRSHLDEGIIPFWLERARDAEHGGYLTNFDERGKSLGTPEKYANTQCRLIWTFSQLAQKRPEIRQCHDLAIWGVDFLLKSFWDPTYGGFFWKTKQDGSRLDDAKIVYGESFCIYALAEYTIGTGDPRGLEYASKIFDLLQKFCADTRNGGYFENLNTNWTREEPGFAGGDRKGLDTHMHLMEAFTTLYQASGQEIHRRKLLEIIDLIATRMIDPISGCGLNQFDPVFNPIPAIAIKRTWNAERLGEAPAQPTETTSYGHNVELFWLMHRALEVVKADPSPYLPAMRRLLDHAVQHGVDWECGGIYRDGLPNGGPLVLEKEFWQHSECLVGFLGGYEEFDDERYLDAFENLWEFIKRFMIISGVGEWRTLVDRFGKPLDSNIGNPWKVSYHTGRAMIECAERLARLRDSGHK